MSICSYLVHLAPEVSPPAFAATLNSRPDCEATPADGGAPLLVLVTETSGRAADEALFAELQNFPEIECLALTFGADETETSLP